MILNTNTNEIIKNLFKNNTYRLVIISSLIVILLSYVLIQKILIPLFYTHMVNIVIKEAKQTQKHIILHKDRKASYKDIIEELHVLKENFNIIKIKILDESGKVTHSTDVLDIGIKNTKDYYFSMISQGKVFHNIINKGTASLDDKIVTKDVAEIYIPIMKNNNFSGAAEFYYDITENREVLNNVIFKINKIFSIIASIFILFLFIVLYKLSRANIKNKNYNNTIEELNEDLKNKVKIRTEELVKANEELKILAKYDTLTGIYNRGYFMKILSKYFNLSERNHTSLYMILFDLDYFKFVNDKYGHAAGDEVLKVFTRIVASFMRKSDIFGRLGGEEFAVCLQNISEDGALIFAQKVRESIENTVIMYKNKQEISITVSIGISKLCDEDCFDRLMEKSDIALYTAKNNGRNQVQVYNEEQNFGLI